MAWLKSPAPTVVAFDIIDTSFLVEILDDPLVALGLGLPPGIFRRLYADTLHDAFALACSILDTRFGLIAGQSR